MDAESAQSLGSQRTIQFSATFIQVSLQIVPAGFGTFFFNFPDYISFFLWK